LSAARLGDLGLVETCLRAEPLAAEARIGRQPYGAPGLLWSMLYGVVMNRAPTLTLLLEAGSPLDPTILPTVPASFGRHRR